jgi:hypothetical protein
VSETQTLGASTNGRPRRHRNIPVSVEFGTPLARLADARRSDEFRRLLGADLAVLLERLGLDGESVAVSVSTVDSQRPIRVSVHGCFQPYPPTLMRRAWLASAPPGLQELAANRTAPPAGGFPSAWLETYAGLPDADPGLVLAFAARLVHAVVHERPSCLLAREQIVRYADRAGVEPDGIASILGPLVDLGVCLSDLALFRDVVREGEELGWSPEDTIEAAFTRMRSHIVELNVHPATLRRLLLCASTDDRFSVYSSQIAPGLQELFRDLEAQFFDRFGFLLPRFDWVAAPAMPEGMLSVRLDAWSSLPVPLVLPGERLAFPSGSAVEGARPTLHPMTGEPCMIVKGEKGAFDAAGVTTWGPIDYVVLNVFAELAARPGRVLGMEEVEYQIARLRYQLFDDVTNDGAYPDLVYAVLARFSIGDLTRVLRAFVDEGLSMRNLPEILERLVHYDTVRLDRDSLILFDDRIADAGAGARARLPSQLYYEYCRKQLKSYVSYRHSWAENTIVAYLLEPALEARAARIAAAVHAGGPRSSEWERQAEAFRDAVWTELQFLGVAPMGQVVLTTAAARAAVRALLAPELPDLPVVAFAELRADVNVQPIARIGVA